MRALALSLSCALVASAAHAQQPVEGVRSPAFASDGRLAVSISGDIWVLSPAGSGQWRDARRVTSGPAWDRDPAWTQDGAAIVFSSDRAGGIDLWRAGVADGQAARLTTAADHEVEPAVLATGAIVFARGLGGDADLWLREPDGTEKRLTTEPGPEREPAVSPDGRRVAYIATRAGRRELRVRALGGAGDTVLVADRQARAPVWAPDGRRIAFGAEGRDAGIWVIGADGRYLQPAGVTGAVPAWSPDGAWIVAADADGGDAGYNGDPDRLGERFAGDLFGQRGGLRRLAAPPALAQGEVVAVAATADRERSNGDAYDRVWSRVARLYYGLTGDAMSPAGAAAPAESAELKTWRQVGVRHRPGALAARDEEGLRDAIWQALRERPMRQGAVGRAGVSSAHPAATAAGVEILELGGNVVDAAVAVSFALSVVEPDASGLGGYGEMLIQVAGLSEPAAIEFMARAPEAATATNPAVNALPRSGPGVANVPGTVAAMELAWKKYGSGKVRWARLLEPAIRLAENGHPISDGFATTLRREREGFAQYPSSRALFFRNDVPLAAGDTLRNPDLAWTLKEIARGGADAFYRGEIAQRMVTDLRAGGNLMTLDDMRRYFAAERRAVRTTYRGNDVFSGPPPVTGGASLIGKLNLLERAPRGSNMLEDVSTLHAMIEAWKFQPSTGGRIADPDLWPVDVTPFESKDTAQLRWRCFDAKRAGAANALTQPNCGRTASDDDFIESLIASATPGEECLARDPSCRATGTTAFVVADAQGNIVSVTQTLGTWGGNFYVSPGLGFLYNDKLRSYGGTGYGARLPYARHTTVISPTIVFRGTGASRRPWFGVGAAGNAWITSAVYQMVVGIMDHGLGAQEALELPRFLVGGRTIQIENGFSPAALRELESMGHSFEPISLLGELRMGYGAAVVITNGRVEAGGDPRRSGTGAVAK